MNKTQVHFLNDYQTLFQQVISNINKNKTTNLNQNKYHLDTNNNFYTPKISKKRTLSQNQYIQQNKSTQPQNIFKDQQIQPLKQTTYYVFGQSSPAKSVEMRKTFVNLGNNRYLINKDPPINFNRTDNLLLQNMDQVQKNSFNINNLTFPILYQSPKVRKTLFPISTTNGFVQPRNTAPKAYKYTFNKGNKLNDKSHSLQLHNKLKSIKSKQIHSFDIKNSQKNPQQNKLNNNNNNKPVMSIQQIQKRLKIQTNDYLKNVVFGNDYEKKLIQVQQNIVMKRRIQRRKQNKSKKQNTQKNDIDAWKHQLTHQNPTDQQLYDVIDHVQIKSLF